MYARQVCSEPTISLISSKLKNDFGQQMILHASTNEAYIFFSDPNRFQCLTINRFTTACMGPDYLGFQPGDFWTSAYQREPCLEWRYPVGSANRMSQRMERALRAETDFDESREEVTRSGLEKLRKNREGGSRNIAKLKDGFFLRRFGSICVKEVGNYSGYPWFYDNSWMLPGKMRLLIVTEDPRDLYCKRCLYIYS